MNRLLEIFSRQQVTHSIKVPYIIAEAGVNHEGKMELAKRLIDDAVEGKADAIKFQTYKAESIASKHSPAYWDLTKESTTSQFALFKKYDKFWKKEFEELKRYCDDAGIDFMSTPFDQESALFLRDLMPAYKISSSDLTNHPFIEYICKFNKPILLSTGASYTWEIQESVELINKYSNPLCLMHCVLNYPTKEENANLGYILSLKSKFPDAIIGYSDHTLPKSMEVLKIAMLLGAEIIEKHFTFDKKLPGNDHYHAMDKQDLKIFHHKVKEVFKVLGSFTNTVSPEEFPARLNARRSLIAAKFISKGEVIKEDCLTWKRPGTGISPKFISEIIGKVAVSDINKDDIIQWTQIKNK